MNSNEVTSSLNEISNFLSYFCRDGNASCNVLPHLRLVCPKIDDKFGTTFESGLSQNAVGSDT